MTKQKPALRVTFAIFAMMGFAACATKPVSNAEMRPPPEKRILTASMLQPRSNTLPIVIKRDAEFRIMPCMVRIYVDGTQVADLAPGEGVTMHLVQGRRYLGAELCPDIGGGELIELVAEVFEGAPSTFRVSGKNAGESINFQPTAF